MLLHVCRGSIIRVGLSLVGVIWAECLPWMGLLHDGRGEGYLRAGGSQYWVDWTSRREAGQGKLELIYILLLTCRDQVQRIDS